MTSRETAARIRRKSAVGCTPPSTTTPHSTIRMPPSKKMMVLTARWPLRSAAGSKCTASTVSRMPTTTPMGADDMARSRSRSSMRFMAWVSSSFVMPEDLPRRDRAVCRQAERRLMRCRFPWTSPRRRRRMRLPRPIRREARVRGRLVLFLQVGERGQQALADREFRRCGSGFVVAVAVVGHRVKASHGRSPPTTSDLGHREEPPASSRDWRRAR